MTRTAGSWSALRRGRSLRELRLDPRLELLERVERGVELAQLGPGRALVDGAQQAKALEPLDCRLGQLVAGSPLDRGLAQPRASALGTGGEARRLPGERVRVDRQL